MATPSSSVDLTSVGPTSLAGRYLRHFWQPVHVAAELKPALPRRIKIAGEHFTLYRGESGSAHLVQDRCPHRGTSLTYGWVEGDCIRCRYHGWKFDGNGKGVEFPAESAAYAAMVGIRSYPVREYLGLIFAYLGEGEAPIPPMFPELEDEARGQLMTTSVQLPHNYFQRIENDYDAIHLNFTHGSVTSQYGLQELPRLAAEETECGMVSISTRSNGRQRRNYCVMPNILVASVPIPHDKTRLTVHLGWRVPIDDENTLSFMVNRVAVVDPEVQRARATMKPPIDVANRVFRGEMTLEDVDPKHPDYVVIQDIVAIGGQGVIADRQVEHLGQSDKAIILLRKIWARELNLLAEGRPLTQWRRPAEFLFESYTTPQAAQ